MTIRHTPTPAELADPALAFTPLVRDVQRADGWTPDRQRGFIAALARLGSVKAACAEVGMSVVGAYYLRRTKGAESFTRAWARAHTVGVHALRDIAYERAVAGTPKGVWYKGERVGEERRYNDRLLMFMLRHQQPALPPPADFKRLPNGSRHPDTVARERRWAEAADGADDGCFDEPEVAADTLGALFDTYIQRCAMERRARLAGDIAASDFMLRQLTLYELLLSGSGAPPELRDRIWPAALGLGIEGHPAADATLAGMFAQARQDAWDRAGDPPRPDLSLWFPAAGRGGNGSPPWSSRGRARKEAEAQMARAIALYEATQSEEAWARFNAEDAAMADEEDMALEP